MGLSSPGIGSNLDVSGIVSKLTAVDRQPIAALDVKAASYQAKISALSTVKSVLAQFQSAVGALASPSKFLQQKGAVGDATVASISATSNAVPGSYSLEVTQLAQSQKLNAAGQVSSTAAIGSGAATTLSFDFGTISGGTFAAGKYTGATFTSAGNGLKTVTIDASNNSLSGIRDVINQAGLGVTASIVNDGSTTPYRLSLTSTLPGAANSLKISVAGDAALSNLLANDPAGTQNFFETSTAQNALVKIDGISVSKPSNTITDAIAGVSINLLKTNAGTPTSLAISNDTSAAAAAVNSFVKAYNDANSTLSAATAFDKTNNKAAILNGESSIRNLQNTLRGVINNAVPGGTSTVTRLSQIGVSVQKDGTLAVDNTKLQAALTNNFSDVASVFSVVGKTSDALTSFVNSTSKTQAGAYNLTVSQLATKGSLTGYGIAGLTITAGVNDNLAVNVDGIAANVTLAAGTYASAATLATEVQSKINGSKAFINAAKAVAVSQTGGVLSITSPTFGSTSTVTVTGGTGAANLKLDGGSTSIVGLDVAGTINGVAATGIGQSLTAAIGNAAEGLTINVTGGILGARGKINFSKGYAYQLNELATTALASGSAIAARNEGLGASIKDITKLKAQLTLRADGHEAQYRKQFGALDTLIGKLNTTSSFLQQQLANLPKIT